LVISKAGLSSVAGFADAYKAVSSGLHSHALDVAFGILIILTLVGSGAVWLEGADRIQAIAALDGAAPSWMSRFSRVGTPITVNLMSGVIGSVFVICVFLITKGSLAHFFSVMIALTISATALAMCSCSLPWSCCGASTPMRTASTGFRAACPVRGPLSSSRRFSWR
jgi:amino acid transporter